MNTYRTLLTLIILVTLCTLLGACQSVQLVADPVAQTTTGETMGSGTPSLNRDDSTMSNMTDTVGAEILWDTWGTPHVFASNSTDAFYAFGWAQMHSHGNLLLQLYAQARGRAAEFFGESYLPTDQAVRLLGIPTLAERLYAQQTPEFKPYLDAFAAGINAYAAANPDALSPEAQAVLPVRGVDVIAHTTLVMASFANANSDCINLLPALVGGAPAGSNAWALGPRYSANGHAMLMANPHLPWSGFATVYQAHIVTPEVDVYGNALLGFPVLVIGFTNEIAWTHTVNTIDGCDAYQLVLAGAKPEDGYLLDGEVQPFETITQTIQVRQADGSLKAVPYMFRRSAHGPVVEVNGTFYALRTAMLEAVPLPGLNEQWWQMAQARNLDEFEQALKKLQLPMFTVIYADRDGHIMALFNGLVPVRPEGDFNYWSRPVAGDDSRLIWTQVHPYADLPKIIDPASGWVQNSNSAPWYMTYPPLDPEDYPPYMAPLTINTRDQQAIALLTGHEQMTFEDVLAAKHSTHSYVADQLLDDLVRVARASNSDLAQQAADALAGWDRAFNADSRGALLFHLWFQSYVQRALTRAGVPFTIDALVSDLIYATPFDPQAILETPRGLADEALALSALEAAAQQLQSQGLNLDTPWGDVARLRRGDYDLPGNGNDGILGVLRVIMYAPAPDGRLQAIGGDTHVAVVEFSEPLRAEVLLTYGNASQANAFELGDQLQLAAEKELHPAWRTHTEIEANLASREVLNAFTVTPNP